MANTPNIFFQNDLAMRRYLVIDDFADMRSMMKSMLHMFGANKIDVVATGEDAVVAMEENHYDIILCDYNLGRGKDGQQVLEETRHRKLINLTTIFVMVTAENTRAMVMGAVEYEPDTYLTKPFTKDLLKTRLERLVVQKAALLPVEQALKANDYFLAISELDQLIQAKPRNTLDLIKLKAELCAQSGRLGDASEIYRSILDQRDLPWARLGLGRIYFEGGHLDDARQMFEQLILAHPSFPQGFDWMSRILVAQGDRAQAMEHLQRAIRISPNMLDRQRDMGEMALQGEDYEIAEKAFRTAVRLGRNSVHKHPSLYGGLVEAKVGQNQFADALKVVEDLKHDFTGKEEHKVAQTFAALSEGMVYQAKGDPAAAAKALETAMKGYQSMGVNVDPELGVKLGKTLVECGRLEEGQNMLSQIARNNHDNDQLLTKVSNALTQTGLNNDGKQWIDGLKKDIVRLNNLGVSMVTGGKLDEAIRLFREATRTMPGNRIINLNAARALILNMQRSGKTSEQLSEVREYLDRVRQIDPENSGLKKLISMLQELLRTNA